MKTRVHINLSVRDLAASKAFYAGLFGTAPSKERPDYANWRLDEPALHLALTADAQTPAASMQERHFGIELMEMAELSQWQTRLEKLGMPLRLEQEVTCCYAVGNKFWAEDPDGNAWEFWVRVGEADAMHASADDDQCCTPAGKAQATAMAANTAAAPKAGSCCAPKTANAKASEGSCC